MSDQVVAPVEVKAVVVEARDITKVAEMAVLASPNYKIRAGKADTFKNLTLAEDEKTNWKKGLIYLIARYSKGVNFELWMYSTKKGAHLAEFNNLIRPLAVGEVKCETLGHALKLRLQLVDTLTDEEVTAKITAFMTAIEPTLQAIREKIAVVVSKKETEAAAPAPAPAAEVVAEVPVEISVEVPAEEAPVSKRQAKKAAKRAAKAA